MYASFSDELTKIAATRWGKEVKKKLDEFARLYGEGQVDPAGREYVKAKEMAKQVSGLEGVSPRTIQWLGEGSDQGAMLQAGRLKDVSDQPGLFVRKVTALPGEDPTAIQDVLKEKELLESNLGKSGPEVYKREMKAISDAPSRPFGRLSGNKAIIEAQEYLPYMANQRGVDIAAQEALTNPTRFSSGRWEGVGQAGNTLWDIRDANVGVTADPVTGLPKEPKILDARIMDVRGDERKWTPEQLRAASSGEGPHVPLKDDLYPKSEYVHGKARKEMMGKVLGEAPEFVREVPEAAPPRVVPKVVPEPISVPPVRNVPLQEVERAASEAVSHTPQVHIPPTVPPSAAATAARGGWWRNMPTWGKGLVIGGGLAGAGGLGYGAYRMMQE